MGLAACGGGGTPSPTPTPLPTPVVKIIVDPTATTVSANGIPVAESTAVTSPDGGDCTFVLLPNSVYMGGDWRITHYNYAMESDDDAFPKDYVSVGGLDDGRQFRRQFIYNIDKGIPMQGTGLAEDGVTYITIDWIETSKAHPDNPDWWNTTSPVTWFFTYGKGGRFSEGTAWASIAVSENELLREGGLREGDRVQIDGYCQIFTVTDTGSFRDVKHIDVFIGATTHKEALVWGEKKPVKVWRIE